MKSVPDDTIYRLKKTGTRVRIVKPKEFPSHPGDPVWLKEVKSLPSEFLTVAEVKNGHRWLAKPEEILTEKEWLASRKA